MVAIVRGMNRRSICQWREVLTPDGFIQDVDEEKAWLGLHKFMASFRMWMRKRPGLAYTSSSATSNK